MKTKQINVGGNPKEDKREAVERYDRVVKPVLESNGYRQLKGNAHTMYNEELNAVVFVTSCPSQIKGKGDMADKIRSMASEYKKRGLSVPTFSVFYTREYSSWSSKPIYISNLRRIERIGRVVGIGVGLGNLIKFMDKIRTKEFFRIGIE
jgi:hypothetical protein